MFPKIFIRLSICVCTIFLGASIVWADITGEIINLNAEQGIAFLDLGQDMIRQGDVFSVQGARGPVYLEVSQASPVISKAIISQRPDYKSAAADFQWLAIGVEATRVAAALKTDPVKKAEGAVVASLPDGMPSIDPQALVKPNIANETIQGLDMRMDKMVESNVKLYNSITGLLNEKKTWQKGVEEMKGQLVEAQGKLQQEALSNADLRKQLVDSEKNKARLDEMQMKSKLIKDRLDNLIKTINERIQT